MGVTYCKNNTVLKFLQNVSNNSIIIMGIILLSLLKKNICMKEDDKPVKVNYSNSGNF